MCGLIGYSGTVPAETLALKLLFAYNQSRGEDSSGVYVEQKDEKNKPEVVKELGKTMEKLLPSVYFGKSPVLVIGHTRKTTSGAVIKENAHPFLIEDNKEKPFIVGAHNGKIANAIDLEYKYGISYSSYKVDSQLLFKIIQKTGEATVLSEIDKLETAVLYTNGDGILRAFRLSDRTLYYGFYKYEDGGIGMYISSIKESLEALECQNIEEFKVNHLYKIKDGVILSKKKLERLPYVKPVTNYNTNSNSYANVSTYAYSSEFERIEFTRSVLFGDDMSISTIQKRINEEGGNKPKLEQEILDVLSDTSIDGYGNDLVDRPESSLNIIPSEKKPKDQDGLSTFLNGCTSSLYPFNKFSEAEEEDVIVSTDEALEGKIEETRKQEIKAMINDIDEAVNILRESNSKLNYLIKNISNTKNLDLEKQMHEEAGTAQSNLNSVIVSLENVRVKLALLLS